jgi:hypothetical protein
VPAIELLEQIVTVGEMKYGKLTCQPPS